MVSYSTSDFRVGLKILIDNDPCVIIEEEFNKPGKGQAFSKIKFRNYLTGRVGEKTCKVGESVEAADVEELDMQFLYSDGQSWYFMHPENYEQIDISSEVVGELDQWITEEDICKGLRRLKAKDIYLDLEVKCPDRDDIDVNFYGSRITPQDVEDC